MIKLLPQQADLLIYGAAQILVQPGGICEVLCQASSLGWKLCKLVGDADREDDDKKDGNSEEKKE